MARKSRKYGEDVPFSITSMMDMMTIILVFMIKNLDAEGQLLTQAENLVLPTSISKTQPTEVSLVVAVDRNFIVVDTKKVEVTIDEVLKGDYCIQPLLTELYKHRKDERAELLAHPDPTKSADEAGKVVIQVDKSVPFDAVYKIMQTCAGAGIPTCGGKPDPRDILNGYSNISFAVMQKNGGEE